MTTLLLGIHSLMFPSYMQKEHVLIWGLLSGGILLCPLGIASIRSWRIRNKEVALLEIKEPIEEIIASVEGEEPIEEVIASVEVEEPIEEVIASVEVEEPIEEVIASVEVEEPIEEVVAMVEVEDIIVEASCSCDVVTHEVEKLSLEEIIEKGFQAKEERNFHLAAEWFLSALDRKPSYDIAFYLIIESYQHWENGYSTKEALNKVRPYIHEYIMDAPPEWSMKLTAWLQEGKVIIEL